MQTGTKILTTQQSTKAQLQMKSRATSSTVNNKTTAGNPTNAPHKTTEPKTNTVIKPISTNMTAKESKNTSQISQQQQLQILTIDVSETSDRPISERYLQNVQEAPSATASMKEAAPKSYSTSKISPAKNHDNSAGKHMKQQDSLMCFVEEGKIDEFQQLTQLQEEEVRKNRQKELQDRGSPFGIPELILEDSSCDNPRRSDTNGITSPNFAYLGFNPFQAHVDLVSDTDESAIQDVVMTQVSENDEQPDKTKKLPKYVATRPASSQVKTKQQQQTNGADSRQQVSKAKSASSTNNKLHFNHFA